MERIIAYGDSWTAGHGVETDPAYENNRGSTPFISNLRLLNSWPTHLGSMLGVPVVNISECGISNRKISKCLIDTRKYLTPDDLVLIMWSYPYRGLTHEDYTNNGATIFDSLIESEKLLKNRNIPYRFINSFHPTYRDYPDQKNQIDTDKFLDIDGCAAQYLTDYEREHDVSVWQYNSRILNFDRQDPWVPIDNPRGWAYHPNFLGYKLIAQYIHEKL